MRIITLTFAVFVFTSAAISQTTKPPVKQTPKSPAAVVKPFLKNGLDSFSYAIGMNIGMSMKAQDIQTINYVALNKGIADAIKNQKPIMDENTCNMTIQQKLQEYAAKKSFAVKEEGRKFLAENKKQPGVVQLPSGIQYKIITQGNGVKPTLEDTIRVHYRGTLIDGNEFDNSYSRGEPIEFPLGNLIEGWKQTLVLMPVGSKWQLFIPSEYAYGDRSQPGIPGGSTLIFELELLDVKPVKK